MTVPEAPANLIATPLNTALKISFTPGFNGNSPITSYEYETYPGLYFSPDIDNNSFTIYGLINGQTYIINLSAVNNIGKGAISSVYGTPGVIPLVNNIIGKNIIVNLNISIDVTGEIVGYGEPQETFSNILYAQTKLSASSLWSLIDGTETSLIEFWEPSDNLDDIYVKYSTEKEDKAKLIAFGLQSVINGEIHAIHPDKPGIASPFNDNKYKKDGDAISQYVKHNNLGRLALAVYAHYIFGHQAATSAITNDIAFMNNILSINDTGSWNKLVNSNLPEFSNWDISNNVSDANIALRLAKAICNKNTTNSVNNTTNKDLARIVKQVISQDVSRAMGQDNNQFNSNVKQKLRFYTGDIIVVSITLTKPTVNIINQGNNNITSSLYDKDGISGVNNDEIYALVIELGE
jgi:hypothetical protein